MERHIAPRIEGVAPTQSDIDRGVLDSLVGLAPREPAEFVVLAIPQRVGADTG